MPKEEKFLLTAEPQDAVFVTTYGWTGGMGEPVLEGMTSQVRCHRGHPIFISEELSELLRAKLPESVSGRLFLVVSANVQLAKKKERNGSIPGSPFQTYWQLSLNRLDDVEVVNLPW